MPQQPVATMTQLNRHIHTVSKIMRDVMASAAEAEIGATFINRQRYIPIRSTLEELSHPQPPTPIRVNNSTSASFANYNYASYNPYATIRHSTSNMVPHISNYASYLSKTKSQCRASGH